ncbi:MAG: glycosyltransferase family 2 protein [Verrucomicrobiota bacterium]
MVNRSELRVVALVTAYNEESTIGQIVDVLKQCPSIDRIQVVDDGSTDKTREEALARDVKVISLKERVPVGQAIMHHLTEIDQECILLWCDADLTGLKPEYMETLIRRFREEAVTQSLSSRGVPLDWPRCIRGWPVRQLWTAAFGPITGERAILRSDFMKAIELCQSLEWAEMMRGYGIVLFLNWYGKAFGNGHVISYFDQLRQRQKYEKWGRRSVREMVMQWIQFGLVWIKIRTHARRIRASHLQISSYAKVPDQSQAVSCATKTGCRDR